MNLYDNILPLLKSTSGLHSYKEPYWQLLNEMNLRLAKQVFGSKNASQNFEPFGEIHMPYFSMGNITSIDLFGLDELIIFAFYLANINNYRRCVDAGANIGLHSIMMRKCGFEVRAFEPDSNHIARYQSNMKLNNVSSEVREAAVSHKDAKLDFVRVLGNTTGNHLKGAKGNPYGELEEFKVTVENIAPHLEWADFAKIDIEGHEAELLENLPLSIWECTDAVIEIGTPENAKRVWDVLESSGLNLFCQKTNWQPASNLDDLPTSHVEGSVFLTSKSRMPW